MDDEKLKEVVADTRKNREGQGQKPTTAVTGDVVGGEVKEQQPPPKDDDKDES